MKHADETTWSCDGKHSYAWGFFTLTVAIFRFRESRGAAVAMDVFGNGPHKGVLEVDRYGAYNKAWDGKIQYCLEHCKRNFLDLLEAEPENKEYREHVPPFVDLLRKAMKLRSICGGDEYNARSREIRDKLLELANAKVKPGRLKELFNTILEKRHRFFQWVDNPGVRAENNLAERELRPLVVSRKVSHGSQSARGLETRETLMTIIRTLMLRGKDAVAVLASALDAYALNKKADMECLLWGPKP